MSIKLKIIILSVFLTSVVRLNGTEVPVDIAKQVALNFISNYSSETKNDIKIIQTIHLSNNSKTLLYVFNFQSGFILVSADDRAIPVLGYSDESQYNPMTKNDGLAWLIEYYKNQMIQIISQDIAQTPEIKAQWQIYLNGNNSRSGGSRNVTPLLTTKWAQGQYYNALCPTDAGGPGGHALVGCVAVAMGQIMKYHAKPIQGTGSHTFNHPTYGSLSANFGTTTYNWSNMPNVISSANTDIATLLYHCGVSVNMNYGPSASGAISANAVAALKQYFSYSNSTYSDHKDGYADSVWEKLLRIELDDGRPVYYAGTDPNNGGHAFVCDGYKENGFFHFNWGWGGYADGYFKVSNLSPAGNNFSTSHDIILVRPQLLNGFCSGVTTLTDPIDTISDGSDKYFYKNSTLCRWLIQPPGASKIYLNFLEFSVENSFDYVNIYDGPNLGSPLIGSYTGNSIPPPVVSSGGVLFIQFRADQGVTDEGWKAVYSVTSTGIAQNTGNSFRVFPNPTSGYIDISLTNQFSGVMSFELTTLTGQIVFKTESEKNAWHFNFQIDLSNQPKGVYILQVKTSESIDYKKIILE